MLRNVRLLYLHNFFTDFRPQWPFQIIYFADITGSYTIAMSVLAVETFSAALFDIPTGIFSDRLGRRLTIACGSLSCALAVACYASAQSVALLYAGAILAGLSQCLFSGNNNALLFESLKSEGLENQYHHFYGRTSSMFQLALCISAFLSIWISGFGLRTIFAVGILPQVIGAVISLMFKEPHQHIVSRPKGLSILKQSCIKTWHNPHLLWLTVAKAINYGAGEAKFNLQSAFVNMLWPIWGVGLYRGLNHALSFVGFQLAGNMIEKFGEPALFIMRDIYWFVTQMFALGLNTFVSPLILLSGSFFFGPGEVASNHLMQKEFTDDERATMGSIASFATSIVFALVALAIGMVSDQFGVKVGLGFGIILGFLSFPVNVWLFRKSLFL